MQSSPLFLLALAALATAKTDLSGCTSSATVAYGGASLIWYVPGTGELCDFLDCGGGRAPPKTTVPGCPLYSGTATYSPSYLPGYNDGVAASTSASAASTSQSSAAITGSSTSAAISQQTSESVISSSDVSPSSGSVDSAVFITSTTGTGTASGSLSQTTATSNSSSSTQTSSKSSSTSTSSGAASTVTGNSGVRMNVHVWHGVVGAGAAGFALLL
ncbi:hypothetical protein BDZ45DRAFT_138881 [Acephala macrosclerotiorum]|nr:hypothetical protein BDZ45DRAFT_138881 [Acephala macrosclerotiorum]